MGATSFVKVRVPLGCGVYFSSGNSSWLSLVVTCKERPIISINPKTERIIKPVKAGFSHDLLGTPAEGDESAESQPGDLGF
jgi:hypothetical protein